MRRIGALMSFGANDPEAQSRVAAFENGLRQLGWVRGHNLSIEYRWADNLDVLRTYATELVGMAPDLILVNSTPATAALQEQRQAVPIVFTQVTDPVGEGLVLNWRVRAVISPASPVSSSRSGPSGWRRSSKWRRVSRV